MPSTYAAGAPPGIALQRIAGGFSEPLAVVSSHDGTGRLFVAEQSGAIRVVQGGAVLPNPFLDLSALISTGGEQGLLGIAFHPEFRCNGRLFVDYTDAQGNTVVAEYHVSATDPDRADPSSARVLLHVTQPFPNHNGGEVLFGPDGDLYIGLGDGGSGGDPMGNGQRVDTLLGKLLRIDVDSSTGGRGYGIPLGNCAGCAGAALPEIFAYGLRNPWRFSFDRRTGDLWIGDVGQGAWEEVDHLPLTGASGANFGWNRMEGQHCYPPDSTCDRTGLTMPVAEYGHDTGDCAVIGGYVYRGTAIPGLAGTYLFSDECTGTMRAIAADGPTPQQPVTVLETGRQITSFGEDDNGELYVADRGKGEVLRVVAP